MIATWPWAALSPLNPIRGLISFGDFHYHIRTILFGQTYEMADVPRYYVPTYIAIRLPLLTLGATLFSLLLIMLPARAGGVVGAQRRELGLIAFTAIFPIACQVAVEGPAFDGCRHFLFVFTPIAVLAGVGLSKSIDTGAISSLNAGGLARDNRDLLHLDGRQALPPASLRVSLLQSTRRRSGRRIRRFVTDYWVNSMPEAVEELHDFLDRTEPATAHTKQYKVAVCGERVSYEEYARPNLQWIKMYDWRFADFYIAPTHVNCDRILAGKVIAKVERMGVTIGVVRTVAECAKRRSNPSAPDTDSCP
jgi:hypothetical protein